jgi:hypothetical protein
MKYPFIMLFACVVLLTLFFMFLTGAVWEEAKLLLGDRSRSDRYLK